MTTTDNGPRTIGRTEALAAIATGREFIAYDDAGCRGPVDPEVVAKAARKPGANLTHWISSVLVRPDRASATRYVVRL